MRELLLRYETSFLEMWSHFVFVFGKFDLGTIHEVRGLPPRASFFERCPWSAWCAFITEESPLFKNEVPGQIFELTCPSEYQLARKIAFQFYNLLLCLTEHDTELFLSTAGDRSPFFRVFSDRGSACYDSCLRRHEGRRFHGTRPDATLGPFRNERSLIPAHSHT